jgi:hypothetical protein
MYSAQWEIRAAKKDQRQVKAELMQLARVFCSTSKARQSKEQARLEKPALRRPLTLGHAEA